MGVENALFGSLPIIWSKSWAHQHIGIAQIIATPFIQHGRAPFFHRLTADHGRPVVHRLTAVHQHRAAVEVMGIHTHGQAYLLLTVGAIDGLSPGPSLAQSRQQHRGQYGDDSDHDCIIVCILVYLHYITLVFLFFVFYFLCLVFG